MDPELAKQEKKRENDRLDEEAKKLLPEIEPLMSLLTSKSHQLDASYMEGRFDWGLLSEVYEIIDKVKPFTTRLKQIEEAKKGP
jgi:hypothetical protein